MLWVFWGSTHGRVWGQGSDGKPAGWRSHPGEMTGTMWVVASGGFWV